MSDLISREALKNDLGITPYNDFDDYIRTERLIDNAPSVTSYTLEDLEKAKNNGYKWGKIDGKKERMQSDIIVAGKCPIEADGNCPLRSQGEIKKYKPLELDYNVQCAVENLRATYWSNKPEKVAKNFTEAEDIIISAICHHGYAVCKQTQGEWVRKEDVIHLLERWADGYSYIEIPTDTAIKAIKEMKGGAENEI